MSFGQEISDFAAHATAELERRRRVIVIEIFSAVVKGTPVLSGRLRGNWQTSIGAPVIEAIPVRDESAVLEEILLAAGKLKGDDTAYLRNNLPYAYRIEYEGWSSVKRPEGMLRVAIANFLSVVAEST